MNDQGRGPEARRACFFRGFRRTRRGGVRPDIAAVDTPDVPVDEAVLVEPVAQAVEDLVERAVGRPSPEAVVDALPRAVALGHVAPGRPALEHPHHAVEGGAVVVPTPAGLRLGHQRPDQIPLPVGQLVSSLRWHPASCPEAGSVASIRKTPSPKITPGATRSCAKNRSRQTRPSSHARRKSAFVRTVAGASFGAAFFSKPDVVFGGLLGAWVGYDATPNR